jgi:zinc protease
MKNSLILKLRGSSLALAAASCMLITTAPAALAQGQPAGGQQNASATTEWGHAINDLTPDPAVRYGVLPNGMKYAIQQNSTPKGGGSVRMRVGVGSIAEAENERGIAHFLEHMAFNGSTNVPEGEMVKMLERLGLAFGADTNATTKFDETVYMLELPRNDDALVDAALMLMRETASELTISAAAVDRERGVVLSERQTRNSPGLRQAEQQFQTLMPQSPFGNRLPIGTEEVLKTVSADTIRNFYRRYYRPDNAALVLVGDFDVDKIEAKIKARFADWQGKGDAGAPQDRGKIEAAKPFEISNFTDAAIPVQAGLFRVQPFAAQQDSNATRKQEIIDGLVGAILSQRLAKLALKSDTRISGGYGIVTDFFQAARLNMLVVNGKEGDWQGAAAAAEQELRRALMHGFTQSELDEALANSENNLKTAALQAPSEQSGQIANRIIDTLNDRSVVTTAAYRLASFAQMKPSITLGAVNDMLRKAWAGGPNFLQISTKEAISDLQTTAMAVLQESMKVAVAAPVEAAAKTFAYDSFGPAGKVASDSRIADLGVRTVKFANGVMLNIKKTDFEAGKIAFGVRIGQGQRAFPADKPGLGTFMSSMSPQGALEAHDFNELQKLLAGRNIFNRLVADDAHFGASGTTTPDDAELQMKILAAYTKAFGYRAEADTLWKNVVPGFTGQLAANPIGISQTKLPRLMAGGDGRIGLSEPSEMLQRNMAELKAVLQPQLASGPIEVSLAGDIDEAKAIDMVARTFGALPKRSAPAKLPGAALKITMPTAGEPVTVTHAGKDDQAVVSVRWATTDDSDMRSDFLRDMLANIMQIRLTDVVREELGATYSPITASFASDAFPGFGYISVDIVAEPGKMAAVDAAIGRIAKEMRDSPISDDLLTRARKPLIEKFDKESRENVFWRSAIAEAQGNPARLERVRKTRSMIETVTAADLQNIAQQYLTDARRKDFRIVSKAVAAQSASAGN